MSIDIAIIQSVKSSQQTAFIQSHVADSLVQTSQRRVEDAINRNHLHTSNAIKEKN